MGMADGSNGVDVTVVNGGGGSRPVRVVQPLVVDGIAGRPHRFAGLRMKAQHALDRSRCLLKIHQIESITQYRDTTVLAADLALPDGFQALFWPLFRQSRTMPGAVTARATPARP